MNSLIAFLFAMAFFFASLHFGRKARSTAKTDADATGKALMFSLPFLLIGFALMAYGWMVL